MIKEPALEKLRKSLSAPGLLATLRRCCRRVPDYRARSPSIALVDALMSGLAVFGIKCPSLLQFDRLPVRSICLPRFAWRRQMLRTDRGAARVRCGA